MTGFDYSDALNGISSEISRMAFLADDGCKSVLKEAGNVYKRDAASYSMVTDEDGRWSGVGVGARASIKKSKEGTGYFLVVKGAKGKAAVWQLANSGFVHAGRGNVPVPGNGFVDKAQIAGDREADKLIDQALKKIAGD